MLVPLVPCFCGDTNLKKTNEKAVATKLATLALFAQIPLPSVRHHQPRPKESLKGFRLSVD